MNSPGLGIVLTLSVLLSFVLAVARLPGEPNVWLTYIRPQWILLICFFWAQQLPSRRGLFFALLFGAPRQSDDQTTYRRGIIFSWIFGLFADVVLNEPFGVNGAIFASITFFVWRFHQRHQMHSMVQQAMMIFLIVFLAEVFRAFVMFFVADQPWDILPLTRAISSALLWPILSRVLLRLIGPGYN
ncbi:MAG: rod shape-determining protein MreD [Candidatus Azotimanducaceae bacterium]|jgi:rod shape-determining protein MreD|tara:strand:- start:2044 stop:2601 length:558 start_codon:yes stop_codon:yes gene_type:complete